MLLKLEIDKIMDAKA